VFKKWLSYRERAVLGRPLTINEAREAAAIVRRLAALVVMGPDLDANYAAVKLAAYSWRRQAVATALPEPVVGVPNGGRPLPA
jgi:hypothetical protein